MYAYTRKSHMCMSTRGLSGLQELQNNCTHPHAIKMVLRDIYHRPLSRRLDRCDRVIQKESGDPNGGNICSFSWATGTSRVRHNADYVPCAQIRFDLYQRVARESPASPSIANGVFAIRAYRMLSNVS